MNRQDRDGSPRGSKRSRSSYGPPDHDMGRGRMSPDFDRRSGGGKFMGDGPPRDRKPFRDYDDMDPPKRKHFRDDRMQDQQYMPPRSSGGPTNDEYRSLVVTNIPSKVSDAALKEAMMHEFWKFGEMNVKVTFSGETRVAYLNFRYPEDARAAKHKGRADMFDRPLRVEPVFNKRRSGSPGDFSQRDHFSFHNRRSSPPPYSQNSGPPPPSMSRGPPEGRQGPPMNRTPPFVSDRGGGGGGGGGPPIGFNSPPGGPPGGGGSDAEGRKNDVKFPFHLDHIDPEFDDKATRTLFVGNLDVNITDIDLKFIFEKYGYLEDIDIKRPQKGQGNAYAFIKFVNLDCAHRAKVEMSGKYVGKFQCKIGYGKVTPTTCIWVGGLGPWISRETLEQEFDRFGAIQKIEWTSGAAFAYVLYDSIEAAKAACQEMRGCPIGGQDRRLRVDFGDVSHINNPVMSAGPPPRERYMPQGGGGGGDFNRGGGGGEPWRSPSGNGQMDRGRGGRREDWQRDDQHGGYRQNQRGEYPPPDMDGRRGREEWGGGYRDDGERRQRPRSPGDFGPPQQYRGSRTPDRRDYDRGGRDDGMRSGGRGDMGDRGVRDDKHRGDPVDIINTEQFRSLTDLAKNLPVAWNGALILKNSAFAARMHVVSGDVTIVDTLMRDPTTTEPPVLRITQRLRLDQPKLEDVGRRISNAGPHGHCILMAMSSTVQNYDETGVAQQRPLKNLVSYLKQKDAAGVISLPPNPTSDKNVGVLHAFPPCQFGYNFLLQRSPKLPPEFTSMKDDYLLVVVVVGAN